ncbi:MAG TPA: phosphate--AMP phosphotransferase [Verrucomicrobia bacterium]|nr:MAG: phosphate--AMP phosphotransferase [Lentisphaerae bacterium GWF2_57_35]HBA86225.1 phosphate--AMP phosphotransferase [Verrucomicrobiota bacterium]
MLRQVDLSVELSKPAYKERMAKLQLTLGELQREARTLNIPIMLVFEGWDAAGKGTMINKLLMALDPRGFNVYSTNAPTEEERLRPFLWRFWIRVPARGRLAIFDRSWYGRVLGDRVDQKLPPSEWQRAYEEINAFERQMADDECVIVKFFLHIGKAEQKKRFKKLLKNPSTVWKVTSDDWRNHKQYRAYEKAVDDMIERTHTPWAAWTVVEAEDERFAAAKIFAAAISALQKKIAQVKAGKRASWKTLPRRHFTLSPPKSIDLSASLTKEEYEDQIEGLQKRFRDLEHRLYMYRVPLIVAYEGWDAAGKGGNIKRLVSRLDPRGYEVIPIAAPNDVEKSRHYLWRFWTHVPKAGHIAIFDRTWYGRVMVERVEGLCRPDEWQRAYNEINDMEAQFVDSGAVVVKFWLEIDKDVQLERFNERKNNPYKMWKITDEDWRNRKKWDLYRKAIDDMIRLTGTKRAPWTVIEANSKYYARIKTLRTVIAAVEKRLKEYE